MVFFLFLIQWKQPFFPLLSFPCVVRCNGFVPHQVDNIFTHVLCVHWGPVIDAALFRAAGNQKHTPSPLFSFLLPKKKHENCRLNYRVASLFLFRLIGRKNFIFFFLSLKHPVISLLTGRTGGDSFSLISWLMITFSYFWHFLLSFCLFLHRRWNKILKSSLQAKNRHPLPRLQRRIGRYQRMKVLQQW